MSESSKMMEVKEKVKGGMLSFRVQVTMKFSFAGGTFFTRRSFFFHFLSFFFQKRGGIALCKLLPFYT